MALMALPALSHAGGFGLFAVAGGGDSTIRVDGQADLDAQIRVKGSGLFYDSNFLKDRIFNYRIGIGQGVYGDKTDSYDALFIFNDFGFSVARNRYARLWLGPEIMLTLVDDPQAATEPKLFGMGMGPVIGLNLNITDNLTATLKVAYISQTMAGHMKIASVKYDVNTDDLFSYISFGMAWRFSEHF